MTKTKCQTKVEVGDRVTVLNKYGDEVAEGFVADVERDGFTLDSGEAILFRHIASTSGKSVVLTVAS